MKQAMDWNLKRMGKIIDNYVTIVELNKIVGPSKLKLWTFIWGQGEHEWHLHDTHCYN